MSGYEEYTRREKASMDELLSRIKMICTEGTKRNLHGAKERGITPTEMAYKTVEDEIYC